MSEYVVKLPDVGEGIAEAEIVEWHVNVGDTIAEDQVMVEVMTDKATVELPSPVAGVVLSVGAAVGEILQVGSPLIRIDTGNGTAGDVPSVTATSSPPAADGDTDEAAAPAAAAVVAVAAPPVPHPQPSPEPTAQRPTSPTAAPAVRQRA
ncbi:MAG: biotin/lipoyl-containing protein, partial [Ilumatobacteraceae bacterium]